MILSVLVCFYLGYIFKNNKLISKVNYFHEYNKILPIICAVSLFMYFANRNFENKKINTIASSILGIYLVHDNAFVRKYIWTVVSPNIMYVSFPYIHALSKVLLVFIICLLIDLIRKKTVGVIFENCFYKYCDAIVAFLQKEKLDFGKCD